jgi:hypothetical protein
MNKHHKFAGLLAIASAGFLLGCGGPANSNLAALNPVNIMEQSLLASVTQNIAGSVLNGQIGSQLPAADQNFRLQQLGGVLQNGAVTQAQQWVNPQTGSSIALNPTGQNVVNPQTQQQCQALQEVVTLPNGQSITESRQACLNAQTGQWALVK